MSFFNSHYCRKCRPNRKIVLGGDSCSIACRERHKCLTIASVINSSGNGLATRRRRLGKCALPPVSPVESIEGPTFSIRQADRRRQQKSQGR
jgi:hypothetical protein